MQKGHGIVDFMSPTKDIASMTTEDLVALVQKYDSQFKQIMAQSGAAKEKKGHLIFTAAVAAISFVVTYWAYNLLYAFPACIVVGIGAFFLFGDEADEAADKAMETFISQIQAEEGADTISLPIVIAKVKVWYRMYEGPFSQRGGIERAIKRLEASNGQWADKTAEAEQKLLALLPQQKTGNPQVPGPPAQS